MNIMSRASRKQEHIRHAIQTGQSGDHGFTDVKIVHNPIPETNIDDIQLSTTLGELTLSSPIIINAMTGGGDEQTYRINEQLALIASEKKLPMAVGSQMAALKDESQAYTYKVVREVNPNGLIFANLGAEATVEQCQRAVDMIQANALQIHLNVVQELVMPEGDRSFKGILNQIEAIASQVEVPLIIKEVGFGINREAAHALQNVGVQVIDTGGFGGTNFALIENKRRDFAYTGFDDWGIKTVPSIIEVSESTSLDVIGSGGIKTPLHIFKALLVGAKAVGMAGHFLKLVQDHSIDDVLLKVDHYHDQLKAMLCAQGVTSIEQLKRVPVVITGESYEWLNLRGYDLHKMAQRSIQ